LFNHHHLPVILPGLAALATVPDAAAEDYNNALPLMLER